ncbi:pentatricopeptide repeat-containing protein At4g32430, mitochondrial [Phoenix dactylifera]|uniref:Pentatricopeptide repeat-containing protein At4g32430, mitochondrial n=1 Tax=Phoenix dactylifera TaxID=42345 RepID=A0A8B7C5D1_PHODC|nr:pentatricopeptide repeat-containing protein At4g32430, mitochondrial [Phoenix dactylifera]
MRRSFLRYLSSLQPANARFEGLRAHSHHQLLDEIPSRRIHAGAILSHQLETIRDRLRSHVGLDPTTVAMALRQCRGKPGLQIHGLVVSSGLDSFLPVSNSLMNMYAKSGSLDLAWKLFQHIPSPDVVSWNTILSGFTSGIEALEFVAEMRRAGVPLDAVTFTMALSFSADLQDLESGQQLHALVFKSGFGSDTFVGNALITAYARCHCITDAGRVFDEMMVRDLVSWNSLLCGLTQEENCGLDAIQVFVEMVRGAGVRPDRISVASVISACSHEGSLQFGEQVHSLATKAGLEKHVSVANVLMSMYYKNGAADCAKRVFEETKERDVITWTTMISIDADNAVSLFNDMRSYGTQPNDVTFVALIYALSGEHAKRDAQMIHGLCFVTGIAAEVHVSNGLITMYARLESMEDSRELFDGMSRREIVTWNALISGYAQNGLCEEALEIFSSLLFHCKPNQYTFGSILSAITAVETFSLIYGQRCHCRVMKLGLNTGEYVSGALIHLYAKHGSIEESQRAFDETARKSLVGWTAIISAHAKHGNYGLVMDLFEGMVASGVHPDHVTFLAVLTACGSKGMVDVGRKIFGSMVREYKIEPWPEHYACMVDMLGRAGMLVEAEELVTRIPTGPGLSALQSLLGACRLHGNAEMGKRVAEALMEMDPMESGAYVLISNLYAEKGEWESVSKIRKGMRERGVKKEVGFSWVDVGIRDSIYMHKFSSYDKTHPLAEEIHRVAQNLGLEMRIWKDGAEME